MKLYRSNQPGFKKKFLSAVRRANDIRDVSTTVSGILADIKTRGNSAILDYTAKFDGIQLKPAQLKVPEAALEEAARSLKPSEKRAIRASIQSVKAFHNPTLPKNWTAKNGHGGTVGECFYPIERVGIYIPGGSVPLVSSVIMNTIPAVLAGVPQIAVFTPPQAGHSKGWPAPGLLGALHLCGIREVYAIGGVQAIGAAAYGTRSIAAVDKVFGPGNAYVNEAKRQVFGEVGVDLQPGPSEVMVITDDGASPECVAADLIAQAEHGTGKEKIYLVALSEGLIDSVKAAIETQVPNRQHADAILEVLKVNGFAVVCQDLDEAAEVANLVAPEHLELQVASAAIVRLTRQIRTAGAILQGYMTPTVLGDFVAGPSHTLPTGRTGRFFSGLRAVDFLRRTSVVRYDRKSIQEASEAVATFSEMEQLDGHGYSLQVRLESQT